MRIRPVVLKLGILYLALCVALSIVLGEVAFHPARKPVDRGAALQAVIAGSKAKLQEVSIKAADGTFLQAWFVQPEKANGNSVILVHGIADNRQGMLGFADLFLSHGYSVLLPDSRGQGESGGIPTYGIRETSDIHRWFSWLDKIERTGCIYGMGESMGAAILLQATSKVPFCAIVAESSFANFREITYIRIGQFLNTGSWAGRTILRPAIELAFLYGRLRYGVWLSSISPETSVTASKVPILLIHGLADQNIPLYQSEMILERCQASSAELWKVPGANHCGAFSENSPEFKRRVIGWYSSHTKRSGRQAGRSAME